MGWSHFLNLLREHNIPKSILNRYTLDEMEDKTKANVSKWNMEPLKQEENISTDQEKVKRKVVKSPMKLRAKRRKTDLGDDFLLKF